MILKLNMVKYRDTYFKVLAYIHRSIGIVRTMKFRKNTKGGNKECIQNFGGKT
jgi:hypothetical protein